LLVYDEATNRLNPDNFKALLHTHALDEKLKEFFFQYTDSKGIKKWIIITNLPQNSILYISLKKYA
jgi:hypothetical protein